MKVLKQFLGLITIISLFSCKAKDAMDFNQKVVGIQKELMQKVNTLKGDTTDGLNKLISIQDLAKAKRQEIKDLKTPSGGEGFKEAMINDFNGIVDSYDVLIKIKKAEGNESKLEPLREEFATWQTKLEKLDNEVLEKQREFAKANNIRLEAQ
jgi:hypothetical protein